MNLDRIIDALSVTAESMGQAMSAPSLAIMAQDLEAEGCGEQAILEALRKVRRECRRLSLADIISRLETADGRPDADEAWMTALNAVDEYATVVWTEETAQAFAIARPALEINDKTGARMAFRAAYERLVTDARAAKRPAQWSASLGFDVEARRVALEAAVHTGKLLPHDASGLLPPPPGDERIGKAVLQLACLNGETIAPEIERREFARKKLAELRAMLDGKKSA